MKINLLLLLASVCIHNIKISGSETSDSTLKDYNKELLPKHPLPLSAISDTNQEESSEKAFFSGYYMYKTHTDTINKLQQTVQENSTNLEKAQAAIPTFKKKLLFGGVCTAAGMALGICLCKTDSKGSMSNISSSFRSIFSNFKSNTARA